MSDDLDAAIFVPDGIGGSSSCGGGIIIGNAIRTVGAGVGRLGIVVESITYLNANVVLVATIRHWLAAAGAADDRSTVIANCYARSC